jgi:hypothetical protein
VATLVDASGQALGEPAVAALVRLDDSQLDPEPLSLRLTAGLVPPVEPGAVRGFTVLIAEPDPRARRFRLELLPGRSTLQAPQQAQAQRPAPATNADPATAAPAAVPPPGSPAANPQPATAPAAPAPQ